MRSMYTAAMWRRSAISSTLPPMSPCSRSLSQAPSCATAISRPSSGSGRTRSKPRRRALRASPSGWGKRCSSQTSSRSSCPRTRPPRSRRRSMPGCTRSRLRFRSISTFPVTAIWPSGWGASSASRSRKISAIRISQRASRSSGGAGTCRSAHGSGIISISRSAAAGAPAPGTFSTSSSSGWRPASGTARRGILFSGGFSMRRFLWRRNSSFFRRCKRDGCCRTSMCSLP